MATSITAHSAIVLKKFSMASVASSISARSTVLLKKVVLAAKKTTPADIEHVVFSVRSVSFSIAEKEASNLRSAFALRTVSFAETAFVSVRAHVAIVLSRVSLAGASTARSLSGSFTFALRQARASVSMAAITAAHVLLALGRATFQVAASRLVYPTMTYKITIEIEGPNGRLRETRICTTQDYQQPVATAMTCMQGIVAALDAQWPNSTVVASEEGI